MGTYENPGIIQRQQATTSQTTSNPLNRLMQVAAQRKADNQAILDANTRMYDNFANKMFEIDQFNFKDFEQNKQDLLVDVGKQYYETANKLNRGEYYVERAKTNRKGEDKTYKFGKRKGDIKYEKVHDPIAARNKLNELMMVPKQYQEVTAAFNSFVQDMDEAFSNGYLETGYVDKNYQDPRLLALYFNAKKGGAKIEQRYDEKAGTLVFRFPMMTEKDKFVDVDGDKIPDEYVELNAREFFLESANGENANQLVQTIPDITAKLKPTVDLLKDLVSYDNETLTKANGKRTTTYLHFEGRNADFIKAMDETPDLFNSTIMISKDAKNIFGVLVDKYAHQFDASEYTHNGVNLTQEYIYNTEASRKSNGEPGKNDTAIKQGQFFEKLLKTYITDFKNGMLSPFEIDQVRSTNIGKSDSPLVKNIKASNEEMQAAVNYLIADDGTINYDPDKIQQINDELNVRKKGYTINTAEEAGAIERSRLAQKQKEYEDSKFNPELKGEVETIQARVDKLNDINKVSTFVKIANDENNLGEIIKLNKNQLIREFLDN
jgi:hypothetical protein